MAGPGTERWQLLDGTGGELSFRHVVSQWATDAAFRACWNTGLGTVAFDSYAWECPPLTAHAGSLAFECVFVSSPSLARLPPDPQPFAGHFRAGSSVAGFESLGRDAWLIAPAPDERAGNFSHLASFTATASDERKDAFWQAVGSALEARIGASPTWLSTAGLGVAWLHVRLDSRPKYYRHAPYRTYRPLDPRAGGG